MSRSDKFRNPSGVYMKLMNFRRFDPGYTGQGKVGLSRGAKAEEEVWAEFSSDPVRCAAVARAVLEAVKGVEIGVGWIEGAESDDFAEAVEGRLLTGVIN